MQSSFQANYRRTARSGFTLVEMLIVAAIMIILTTMTVAAYTATASADRIRTSARQVQSALSGARDRGIKAVKAEPLARRGLRFLVDATDPTIVTSMTYVGTDVPWTDGQVIVGREDTQVPGDPGYGLADSLLIRTLRGWPRVMPDGSLTFTGWRRLYDQGLLVDGSRIRIPAGPSGNWYTVLTGTLANYSGTGPEILQITTDFQQTPSPDNFGLTPYDLGLTPDSVAGTLGDDDQDGTPDNPEELGAPLSNDRTDINPFGTSPLDYELELKATVLPGQEPLRLSSGIAIDLFNSAIPNSWFQQRSLARGSALPPINQGWGGSSYYYNGWGTWAIEGPDPSNAANDIYRQYSPRMDVMFSPQGTVTGPLVTVGMLHFRLADVLDIGEGRNPANPEAAPMLYSTLFTQTGYVATFPVNITDSNNDGYADDPLYFARIGGTAGR